MKKLCHLLLGSLLLCLGHAFAAGAAETGVTDSSISIGMTAPFSGPNGSYGVEMREVIEASFRQINSSGGIHGRKLQLVALDDGYETERALANTRTLINEKKVFALLAAYGSSPTTAAMNEVFGPAGVPLIGTISGADSLRQPPRDNASNRYMFNVRTSYANESEAIVKHLAGLGLNNIAVFYQNDGFGKSGLDGVTAALKKRNLAPSALGSVERNSLDVGKAVQSIARANAQVVLMVSLYKPSAEFVRQMRKAGQHPQFFSLSPVGADLLVRELGDEARGIGIAQVMPYPWNDATPAVREYQRLLSGERKPSYYGIEAYLMSKTLAEGLRKAGRDLSREKLIAALESLQNHDLGGYRVSFGANDRSGSSFVDLTVIGSGGRVLH